MDTSRSFHILGTGSYLPKMCVPSTDLDIFLGKKAGWVEQKSGVRTRHRASSQESVSVMAANAVRDAAQHAGMGLEKVDCLIAACSVGEQALPCTASLIQKQLGLADSGIPCFDINASCLSFLTALDMATHLLQNGAYKCIAIVSAEKPSVGLDWADLESATIFGDGAAAVIISKNTSSQEVSQPTHVLTAHMETYSEGAHFCEIAAGGSGCVVADFADNMDDFQKKSLFFMDGKAAFRLSSEKITPFMNTLLQKANLSLEEIDWVVPHQASHLALHHLRKRVGFPTHKVFEYFPEVGNQVAASLPLTLHRALGSQKIAKGDKVLLIGTAAGLSLGGMIIAY